jgi:glycosidase
MKTTSCCQSRKWIFPVFLFRICLLPILTGGLVHAAPPTEPWWQHAVFYEVFVRSFADSNQGPLANDGTGDLQGLVDRLDYLNDGNPATNSDLGVTALWLMPIHPSPSYHGYDVTDYFNVNPQYGDLSTMRQLIKEAHRRGIRVIIDLVLNHASSQHPLFVQAKSDRSNQAARHCFRFSDLPIELSGPWDQRVWHPSGREFYYGVFSSEMPDWNFRDQATTEHHRRVAEFWLKQMDVDGFRLDAVRYFFEDGAVLQDAPETLEWLRAFTEYCHSLKPDCFLVGECSGSSSVIAPYAKHHSQDSLFEFGLSRAVIEAIRFEQPGILTQKLAELSREYNGVEDWSSFLANHDQDRTVSQLDGNVDEAKLAAQLEFVLPGIPFIYYGEEIGMTGHKPDEDLRTPMQWTAEPVLAGFTHSPAKPWRPAPPDSTRVNVAAEDGAPDSLLNLYRRLVRMRLENPLLFQGTTSLVNTSNDRVFACLRQQNGSWILVVANLGAEPAAKVKIALPKEVAEGRSPVVEILQDASVAQPKAQPHATGTEWIPLKVLAPHTVYVLRPAK